MSPERLSQIPAETKASLRSFEDLDFRNISLRLIDIPGRNWRRRDGTIYQRLEGQTDVLYEGEVLPIHISQEKDKGHKINPDKQKVHFEIGPEKAKLIMNLEIIGKPGEAAIARTEIGKDSGARGKHKGLGIKAYGKMLDFISEEAKARGRPIVHIVSMITIMTSEQWIRTFEPVLIKRGYVKTVSEEWTKEYLPNKKPHTML